MSILDGPCGLENVKKIARELEPPDAFWDVYRYPGRPFVTKVEDPGTERWSLVDCREKMDDAGIKERISSNLIGEK